jgi:hypothetical protein
LEKYIIFILMKPKFFPTPLGVFALVLALLLLGAGHLRRETILLLGGAVFSAAALYSAIAVLLTGLFQRKKANNLAASLAACFAKTLVRPGETVSLAPLSGRKFFCIPGVLLRCELTLATKDERVMLHTFDPGLPPPPLEVKERGAWFERRAICLVFDGLGFFRMALPMACAEGPRLFSSPEAFSGAPAPLHQPGGASDRAELRTARTDDLTGHRPYFPGDDPRRINWKLYGHGGELFVREGEFEPPPHSELFIIIDTWADPSLYNKEQARRGIDALAGCALSLVLELQGRELKAGFPGCEPQGGDMQDMLKLLSQPAAEWKSPGSLPVPPEKAGALILALPRLDGGALDDFLKKRGGRPVEIIFVYQGFEKEAAEACARIYSQGKGSKTRSIQAWPAA